MYSVQSVQIQIIIQFGTILRQLIDTYLKTKKPLLHEFMSHKYLFIIIDLPSKVLIYILG